LASAYARDPLRRNGAERKKPRKRLRKSTKRGEMHFYLICDWSKTSTKIGVSQSRIEIYFADWLS